MQKVVGKVFFDYVSLVAAANDKFVDAVMFVRFENMPQNWLATDLHHWLGFQVGLLADTGTKTAGQNYGFHVIMAVENNL